MALLVSDLRHLAAKSSFASAKERTRLAKLAARARKLADAGLAHLVQRRHDAEDFSYFLIVARRPYRAMPTLLAEAAP